MKIIAFAGSNSSRSINKELVNYVLKQLEHADTETLDLNSFEMPIYSRDREKDQGIPSEAHLFREHMRKSDGIVCSLAEHNNTYTVAFKNILDWCSRVDMNIFDQKPMLLMSTSPGRYGGGNVMGSARSFFPKCGANIVETFSLPSFKKHFEAGSISDEDLKRELFGKVESFMVALTR